MVNNEYDYIRGNTAIKPKRKITIEKEERETKARRKKRERQRQEARQNKSIVMNILHVATVILILEGN